MTKQLLTQTKNYSLWLGDNSEIVFRNENNPIKEDISIHFTNSWSLDSYFHKFICIQCNSYGWTVSPSSYYGSNYILYMHPVKPSTVLKTVLNHYSINATAKADIYMKTHVHIVPKTDKDRAKFLLYFGNYIKQT